MIAFLVFQKISFSKYQKKKIENKKSKKNEKKLVYILIYSLGYLKVDKMKTFKGALTFFVVKF